MTAEEGGMTTTAPAKGPWQGFRRPSASSRRWVAPRRARWAAAWSARRRWTSVPSAKRLVGRMRPDRGKAVAVVLLGGSRPADVGRPADPRARDRPGVQRVRRLQDPTRDSALDVAAGRCRAAMDVVPGQGVDFGALADVLLLALAVYAGASLLGWLPQGFVLNTVVQNTIRQLRRDVEDKISRLPLGYFDRSPRGELLSRVTNDIDNVSQTLQQTMSQLLTSVMTVLAVLAMMIWISPARAGRARDRPLSLVVTAQIMKRSQGQFVAQWRRTGTLNAQVEEAFSVTPWSRCSAGSPRSSAGSPRRTTS